MMKAAATLIALVFVLSVSAQKFQPIDAKATTETKNLYHNLHLLAKKHTLFGHQHATEYGHGWQGDADRSDVKSVTGSHPAVIGVDFSGFTAGSQEENDNYKAHVKKIVEDTYNRGAVITVAWHFPNPVSGGGFYWKDSVSLWKFTVAYLRDSLGVHNFIYAFSPDNQFLTEEKYLERYPGDAWVDMVGMDNYGDMGRDRYALDVAAQKLKIVSDYAKKSGKLAAFTETGLESLANPTWWNETLLKVMKSPGLELCYVLVWRNDSRSPTHYYAPFPGHSSVPDFIKFYQDPYTIFEKDLRGIYGKMRL